MTELSLIPVEKKDILAIFSDGNNFDPLLQQIEKRALDFQPDVATKKGRDEIASMAYQVSRSKTFIDGIGKDLVADWKSKAKVVDASRKKCRDFLDGLKERVSHPLTEWKAAEDARIQLHENNLDCLEKLSDPNDQDGNPLSASVLKERLNEAESTTIDSSWEEYVEAGERILAKTIESLKLHIERREKYEAEQAELERLRKEQAEREKREYEDRLKREAAEKARLEAETKALREREELERKEREAREAAERAERERVAAIERAERDKKEAAERAERARIEAIETAKRQAREEAERKERERIAKEAAKKAEAERIAANKNHQKRINREAVESLVGLGYSEDGAMGFVTVVAKGLVKNITINY